MPLAGHAPDEIAAWLRLLQTPGCGRQRARQLLAAFGSPEGVFAASSVAQRQIVGEALVQALRSPPDGLDALVDATLDWLAHPDHHLLILGDEGYRTDVFRSAARRSHPDQPGGSQEAFHLVTAAKAVLEGGA